MKSGDAQRNVQNNSKDNMNWRDQNIYNIYSKKDQHETIIIIIILCPWIRGAQRKSLPVACGLVTATVLHKMCEQPLSTRAKATGNTFPQTVSYGQVNKH